MSKRKVMGRPLRPDAEKQSCLVGVRLNPADFRQLKQDADKAGLSLSAYLAACWRRATGREA